MAQESKTLPRGPGKAAITRAKRELDDQRTMCWEMVESVNSIILRWDTKYRVTFINDFAQKFFGYDREEILGKSLIGTIVPRTSASGRDLAAMIADIVRHPERYVNNESENVRRDGSRVWISWTNKAVTDERGSVVGILSVGNDITERKHAEEALRRQLHFTQTLLDDIAIPVFYKDTRGVYTGCNRAFQNLLGVPKDRIIGKTVYDVAPRELAEVYHKADQELFRHPGKQVYEGAVIDSRGGRHDVVFIKATFFDEEGRLGGLIGTVVDITERKAMWEELVRTREELERRVLERTRELEEVNASLRQEIEEHKRDEEALRESQADLARAQEIAHVGVWSWDVVHGIMRWTDEVCRIFGQRPREFQPTYGAFLHAVVPEDRERVDAAVKGSLDEGKHFSEDFYIRRPDGKLRFVHAEGGTIFDGRGRAVRMLGVSLDITERKRALDALREAKSRAELYLDLMSHDISNMNQAMMGYLEIARDTLPLDASTKELIERPLEIIRHSSVLIGNVKKLEQVQSGRIPAMDVDLGAVLSAVKASYAHVPGRQVKINYTPIAGCTVKASDLLKDVFDQLVDNAIRHSTGPLTIDMAIDRAHEQGRAYCRVTVADTGPGIPDDLKRRMFRFVQEDAGKARRRGLGLFFVKTIVESCRGRVWVEDRVPGDYRKGSKFVVLLPVASA